MPTAGELTIILEAQDRASAQLRQVGQEVQRLEQQVEGMRRSTAGRGGLLGGLSLGAGFAAAQQAFAGVQGFFDAIGDSVIGINSRLEQTTATFTALTGSVGAAADVVAALRREAATSPFNDAEVIAAGRALITSADGSTESLLKLIRVAEQLAAVDPAQGLEGASVALREAMGGDFESLIQRFEISRQAIARFRAEGLSNLDAVTAALRQMGVTSELVERLGQTFEGRRATIVSFFDELRGRLGAGVFERISEAFGHMVNLISRYGDQLRQVASTIGQTVGAVFERLATVVAPQLTRLLDALAPGLGTAFTEEFARVPDAIQQVTRAAQEAAPVVATLERQLAGIGVAAAEQQAEAERVRRAYDGQLEPLERQLRLLQQSGDLQRVQNALATNRATVEQLRLDTEIAALQRAAGGAVDPAAAGLTARQRAIALALQERQLRREELGLTEQQRPAVQSLQERIQAIQEAQRAALEPLQRQLQTYRDQADALQLQRQRAELLKQDLEAAAASMRRTWEAGSDPEALANARQRGQQLADEWLKGWEAWINAGGGTVWGALLKSLQDWWTTTGQPAAIRIGAELGTAIGAATGVALQLTLGPQLKVLQDLDTFVTGIQQRLAGVQAGVDRVGTALGPVLGTTPPVNPTVDLGRVNPFAGGGGTVNVTIESGAVAVGTAGGVTPEELRRARDETIKAVTAAFAETAATTEPGATNRLAGAGR